jgi:hypothetical protein
MASAPAVNGAPQRSDNAPNIRSGRVRKLSEDQVQELINAPKTPRVFELERYQAFFECTAYNGRPSFFTDDKPMQERKPCIIYPIVKIAAESNVAFAMGEGRFPTVLSQSSEDDTQFDDELGVSKDESTILDAFNAKLVKLARLERVFRQAYRMAQAARSVAIVVGFRAGRPFADLVWSKLCRPFFDDPLDPQKCTRLEIRYRYTEKWRDPALTGGEWWTRVFEYLRVIDDTYDTVYQPVDVWDVTDPGAIDRKSATRSVTKHDFGFCPVHWYARNLESVIGSEVDGRALHDGSCDLIEQLDFALSQRHRAAIYAGDPQTVLTGITDDDDLGATGRTLDPNLTTLAQEGGKKYGQAFAAPFRTTSGALKRGVMHPWMIKDPAGKAVVIALPGDALDALDKDAQDIGSKVCDALGITIVDPSMFGGGGDLSGRTLAFIFSKQINRVSQDREDLGRCCILPVLNLFYRMLVKRSDGVYLPGIKKTTPILARFYKDVAANDVDGNAITVKVWFAPQLELKWGDYFEPSDVDESTRVGTAVAAYSAKVITLKTVIEHLRGVFAISNVDQYADTLQKEVAQRQQEAIATAQAMAPTNGPPKPGAPKGDAPAAQQSPNAAPPASSTPKASRKAPLKKKAA